MTESWFKTGKEGWSQAKKEDEAAKQRRAGADPWRFRLEADSSAKMTFIDTPTFFFHEHSLKVGGRWTTETCINEFDTCPLCESGLNVSYVVAGTCINHSKYVTKKGQELKNQKQLFVGKGRARQRLQKQIERRDGDLSCCVYEMSRGTGQTECATGEDFEYIKRLQKKQLRAFVPEGQDAEEWLAPYDYAKIFKPKTAEQLAELVGAAPPVGGENDDTGGDKDTDGVVDPEDGKELSIEDLL